MTDNIPAAPTNWLQLAQEAHTASTMYFDSAIRKHVESGIRLFQSRHLSGSKYESETYKLRSKLFRPKTRMVIRKNTAVAAEAFFATKSQVSIEANNEADEMQRIASSFIGELVDYRLKKTIPWFMTVLGAYQETQVNGVVISHQYWDYDEATGTDKPVIELCPVENIRIDPAANWVDPINSSPYVIHEIPMYVKDARAKMKAIDQKTNQPIWKEMTDAQLQSAMTKLSDPTRLVRQGGRMDPKTQTANIRAFDTIWVHRNIINYDGQDWLYYTLGTTALLSDPIPLKEAYLHGKRPYVMGICEIEAHKIYPSGVTHLGEPLQREINDLVNRQHDLLAQVLNKRYLVKRNKQVDVRSLTRHITGVTLVDDVDDVKWMDSPDVNPSSFQTMDRLNLDFDEVTGSFSQSSVNSNRQMNETVGGMQLSSADANQVSGLNLRTFVETWAEPVIRQLVALEQAYETDEVILYTAGAKAKILDDINAELPNEVFSEELSVSVNIGMGATNPAMKLQSLLGAIQGLANALADGTLERYGMNVGEVIKEVMGFAGYKDGARFFSQEEDARVTSLTSMVSQLQAQLASKQQDPALIQAQVDKIRKEIDVLEEKRKAETAKRVETGVKSIYSAVQTAGVIATAPQIAPMADQVMQASGYTPPDPMGIDPNIVTDTATQIPPSGVELPATTNTDPTSPEQPAQPASPETGAGAGIETQEI
ncbi:MAG: hypothetical protein LW865_14495 [Betaproteobacteria bacterium]|nr:hypothetical protein [Betaproteobacteria bacterium]